MKKLPQTNHNDFLEEMIKAANEDREGCYVFFISACRFSRLLSDEAIKLEQIIGTNIMAGYYTCRKGLVWTIFPQLEYQSEGQYQAIKTDCPYGVRPRRVHVYPGKRYGQKSYPIDDDYKLSKEDMEYIRGLNLADDAIIGMNQYYWNCILRMDEYKYLGGFKDRASDIWIPQRFSLESQPPSPERQRDSDVSIYPLDTADLIEYSFDFDIRTTSLFVHEHDLHVTETYYCLDKRAKYTFSRSFCKK